MGMDSAILTLAILIGIAQGESIISPPEDVTELVGKTATFHCEIEFEQNAIMIWEHNKKAIYSYYIGGEDYKVNRTKHSVEDERKFTLTVNDLEFSDGGTYTCRTIRHNAAATLIVLRKPVLSLINATSSGKAEKCRCVAEFGGPSKLKIPANQFPRLHMYLNGIPLPETVKEQGLGNGREYHRLQQDIKLEPSMKGKTVFCEIRTSSPEMSLTEKIPVKTVHWPDPVATSQPVNDKDGEDDERNPDEGDGKEETRPSDKGDSLRVWLIVLAMAMTCFVTIGVVVLIVILRSLKKINSSNLNEGQKATEQKFSQLKHKPEADNLI